MFEEAARAIDAVEPEDSCRKEVLGAQLDLCLAAEQWDTAIVTAASLIRLEPHNPAGWLALAHVMTKAANPEYAQAVLLKARQWHPTIDLLIVDMARDATIMGCLHEAKVWLSCAIPLRQGIRELILQDEDFKPLWDWVKKLRPESPDGNGREIH